MSVSEDAPALDIVYKLSEYGGEGRTKLSPEKPILPGRKQVFRQEKDGTAVGDVIGAANERIEGRPLLRSVMRGGQRLPDAIEPLASIRHRAAEELAKLPPHITAIVPADPPYPVAVSAALKRRHEEVSRRLQQPKRER
jgi:nicotinate phosphoribosyltransferase